MKKIRLFGGLLTLLSSSIYADTTDSLVNATLDSYAKAAVHSISQQITLAQNDTSNAYAAAPNTTTTTTQKVIVPANTTTTTAPAITTTTTVPTTTTAPATTTTTATVPPATGTTSMSQPINCNYHIPPETTHIEHGIVMEWANNATRQSFDFDHVNITQQLGNLRPCYTDQGWQSFNDALNKSGNLSAIRTQKLMVTSTIDGTITVTDLKENQWRVRVPLQVIYQNEKQKLTQLLTVDLIIGRKISGDLGIMQMIASPRQAITTVPATTTTTKPAQ